MSWFSSDFGYEILDLLFHLLIFHLLVTLQSLSPTLLVCRQAPKLKMLLGRQPEIMRTQLKDGLVNENAMTILSNIQRGSPI